MPALALRLARAGSVLPSPLQSSSDQVAVAFECGEQIASAPAVQSCVYAVAQVTPQPE